MIGTAEYIWLDGAFPTQQLRSKSKIIQIQDPSTLSLDSFGDWGFDGSSTFQAQGEASDLVLKPVNFCVDPFREKGNYLVLCEVFTTEGKPHNSNMRAHLRKILELGGASKQPLLGFEQEYTLFQGRDPLGWPTSGFPEPQGPFYCGVGTGKVFGRELVEAHTQACIDAGLSLFGTNAEVMPGQWEFQVGYRGFENDNLNAMTICDHLWLARWLLHRVAEDYDVKVSFDNKPVKGDWNGAGCHTNFSTLEMREAKTGIEVINKAIQKLKTNHSEHVKLYGHNLESRLTGLHETCTIDEFHYGVGDRGASIRVPSQVFNHGGGYFEDRRPGANCDPYLVATRLIATVCDVVDETIFTQIISWHKDRGHTGLKVG